MCVHARADIRFVAATATLRRRPIEMVAVASSACRVGQAEPLEIASQSSGGSSTEQKTMLDEVAVSIYTVSGNPQPRGIEEVREGG
jgi:hypothetical protein